jgi:hypothetical protein
VCDMCALRSGSVCVGMAQKRICALIILGHCVRSKATVQHECVVVNPNLSLLPDPIAVYVKSRDTDDPSFMTRRALLFRRRVESPARIDAFPSSFPSRRL